MPFATRGMRFSAGQNAFEWAMGVNGKMKLGRSFALKAAKDSSFEERVRALGSLKEATAWGGTFTTAW